MNTLKVKLMFLVSTILILTIGVQLLSNAFLVKSYFVSEKTAQMEESFETLKTVLESHENIKDGILHYEEDEHINISVWDTGHNPIYSSVPADFHAYEDMIDQFSESPVVRHQTHPESHSETLTLLGKILAGNQTIYVVLNTPVSAVERSVALVNIFGIRIALLALIIGCLVTWFWSQRFVQPIVELDHIATQVSQLNFSKKYSQPYTNDELGHLAKSIDTMSDQLSEMIDSLKKTDIMRQEFIANVSHEFKSPLGLLVMYCENLKENLPDIDKAYYYDVIIDESRRLSGLVKKLLDISSLENGLISMESLSFDFSELVLKVAQKKQVPFDSKQVTLDTHIQKNLMVDGDAFYLEQALTNYLDNALNYTPQNKTVILTLQEEANTLVCSVFNEGSQIALEDSEKIWDSFYKIDKAHTPSSEPHAGLGLYIVRTIIIAHSGTYGVKTDSNGVTFWFRLPLIH